jgi:hypothetical protein
MPLEKPNQQHLHAAHGYIGLGMFEEANAELEEIDPFCRHLPEVLIARIAIYCALKKWELMAIVGKNLVEWNSDEPQNFVDWAYATRRAESIHLAHANERGCLALFLRSVASAFGCEATVWHSTPTRPKAMLLHGGGS